MWGLFTHHNDSNTDTGTTMDDKRRTIHDYIRIRASCYFCQMSQEVVKHFENLNIEFAHFNCLIIQTELHIPLWLISFCSWLELVLQLSRSLLWLVFSSFAFVSLLPAVLHTFVCLLLIISENLRWKVHINKRYVKIWMIFITAGVAQW